MLTSHESRILLRFQIISIETMNWVTKNSIYEGFTAVKITHCNKMNNGRKRKYITKINYLQDISRSQRDDNFVQNIVDDIPSRKFMRC